MRRRLRSSERRLRRCLRCLSSAFCACSPPTRLELVAAERRASRLFTCSLLSAPSAPPCRCPSASLSSCARSFCRPSCCCSDAARAAAPPSTPPPGAPGPPPPPLPARPPSPFADAAPEPSAVAAGT